MAEMDVNALYREGLTAQQAGDVAQAISIYDRILAARPGMAEVLFQKARCLSKTDGAAAEIAFREALVKKPKEPAIWQGLHGVLSGAPKVKLEKDAKRKGIPLGLEVEVKPILAALKAGKLQQAEAAAARLTQQAPVAFWPAYALGLARLAMRGAAIAPLEAAVARDPSHGGARTALARAYLAAGRPIVAEAILAKAAATPEVVLLQARILRDTARSQEAVDLLQGAAIKAPQGPAEMAVSLAQTGQGAKALNALQKAVGAGAKREPLSRIVAVAAEEAGDISGAEAVIDAALVKPSAGLLIHRAQLHQSAGEMAQAEALLTEAITAEPGYGEAFRAYANGRKMTADDTFLPKMEAALSRAELKAPDRAALHFAMAKTRGDLGQHERVFDHLSTANRLLAKGFPYGFDADVAEARALVADWKTLREAPDPQDTTPVIFVTGLPRSGTTLVEQILGAHSATSAGGEMPFLGRALAPVLEAVRFGTLTDLELGQANARYLTAAQRRVGAGAVIVDKAISTFSRIGHAAKVLPGAKIVLVKRDPRDVALSLYRNMFAEGRHRYANDLQTIGRYIRLHDAITEFWIKALPDRVHVVDYEALTAEPEVAVRALLEAVGLSWEDSCLTPEAAVGRIQTLSFAQARQPIGTGAVAGWQRFEAELAPLIKALETEIDLSQAPKQDP